MVIPIKVCAGAFSISAPVKCGRFSGNSGISELRPPPFAKIGAALERPLKDRAPCVRLERRKKEKEKRESKRAEKEERKKEKRRKQGDDRSKKKGGSGKRKQERKTEEGNGRTERGLGAHVPARPFFRSFEGELFAHFWPIARRGVRFPRIS